MSPCPLWLPHPRSCMILKVKSPCRQAVEYWNSWWSIIHQSPWAAGNEWGSVYHIKVKWCVKRKTWKTTAEESKCQFEFSLWVSLGSPVVSCTFLNSSSNHTSSLFQSLTAPFFFPPSILLVSSSSSGTPARALCLCWASTWGCWSLLGCQR